MRTIIVMLLVTAMTLAGCAGDKETVEPVVDQTPDEMIPPTNVTEMIPIMNVTLSNGTAPLSVNFTLAAANSTGNLTWILQDSIDGNITEMANGTTLPATVTYVFNLTGNHTVTFTVSAATNATTMTNINVSAGVVEPLAPTAATTSMTLTGDFAEGATDTVTHEVPVDGPIHGATVHVTWDDGVVGNAPTLADIDLFIKDGSGKQVAALETTSFEYIHLEDAEGMAEGTWTFDVLPYDIPTATSYSIEVIFWHVVPQQQVFEGTATAGVNFLASVGDGEITHAFAIPAAETVATRLAWDSAGGGACATASRTSNDWDLSATLNGAEVISSGNFAACEFGFKSGDDLSGDWEFIAVPFAVAESAYTMTVLYA